MRRTLSARRSPPPLGEQGPDFAFERLAISTSAPSHDHPAPSPRSLPPPLSPRLPPPSPRRLIPTPIVTNHEDDTVKQIAADLCGPEYLALFGEKTRLRRQLFTNAITPRTYKRRVNNASREFQLKYSNSLDDVKQQLATAGKEMLIAVASGEDFEIPRSPRAGAIGSAVTVEAAAEADGMTMATTTVAAFAAAAAALASSCASPMSAASPMSVISGGSPRHDVWATSDEPPVLLHDRPARRRSPRAGSPRSAWN